MIIDVGCYMACYLNHIDYLLLSDAVQIGIQVDNSAECPIKFAQIAQFSLTWNSHAQFSTQEILNGRDQRIFFFCSRQDFSTDQCHKYLHQKVKSLQLKLQADDYTQVFKYSDTQMMLTIVLVAAIVAFSGVVLLAVYLMRRRRQKKMRQPEDGDTEIDPLVLEKPGMLVDSGMAQSLL